MWLVEYLAALSSTWMVADAATFKFSQCQKLRNVKFITAYNNNLVTESFTEDVVKYYYQPLLKRKYCFKLSMTVFTSEGTLGIDNGDYDQREPLATKNGRLKKKSSGCR